MSRRWSAVLASAAAAVAAAALTIAAPAGHADDSRADDVPVLEIHGFDSADCPGSDVSAWWSKLNDVFDRESWTGPTLPVSYYRCDDHGADITGYGPDTPATADSTLSEDRPRVAYDADTSLVTLAHDLAWFVYRNFSVADRPVDVVALSLGGLIARTALLRVQQHDPDFPPFLRVAQAVTFSTPHHGLNTVAENAGSDWCHHLRQCEEIGSDSPIMTELMRDGTDPQGRGGTRWTVFGSSQGCDFVPVGSSLGLPHATQIDYTDPCYDHTGYIFDDRDEHAATAVTRAGDDGTPVTTTDSAYSLRRAVDLLRQPQVEPGQTPTTGVPTTGVPTTGVPTTGVPTTEVPTAVVPGTNPPVSPTSSAPRPRTTPSTVVDDRAFHRSRRWVPIASPRSVGGTLSRARSAGATASVSVRGRGIALVVRTCPTCGSVRVLVAGHRWRTVSTRSRTASRRVVITLPSWPATRTATITLRTTSRRPVYLDGLAVRH